MGGFYLQNEYKGRVSSALYQTMLGLTAELPTNYGDQECRVTD
jgi:hypothetical protein